jgi:glycosyltransferase involved in cell wall biosynthesis
LKDREGYFLAKLKLIIKMMKHKTKLLIIGSSQGVYGGIEAFMIAIANASKDWPEFDVRLCFKMVSGASPDENLRRMSEKACSSVFFVEKVSVKLFKLLIWADILHVQNMPPDIVFTSTLLRKKIFLTVHNRKHPLMSFHNFLWSFAIRFANKRWYNSNFVWNSWEPDVKKNNSDCIPTVCVLPTLSIEHNERKGFIFVGRWIENKGIEEVLYAYAKCKLDQEEWPLTILGDGPLKSKVHEIINRLGLEDVIMPGFVDDLTKEKLVASSKWLLAPAKTLEDLGLTPIEARSVGVPAIVTRDGGLPESAGPFALIAEPGNVDSLVDCMLQATNMNEDMYFERSEKGKESLLTFLKPIGFYREQFLR